MEDFLKMDIFFVVTTAVVLCGGTLFIVALVYFIKILRSVDNIAQNVSAESDSVRGDLEILRTKIREEGMKVKHIADFFGGMAARKHARKKAEKK
jgi:hypothetical protein